jgi:hypothetical protein
LIWTLWRGPKVGLDTSGGPTVGLDTSEGPSVGLDTPEGPHSWSGHFGGTPQLVWTFWRGPTVGLDTSEKKNFSRCRYRKKQILQSWFDSRQGQDTFFSPNNPTFRMMQHAANQRPSCAVQGCAVGQPSVSVCQLWQCLS